MHLMGESKLRSAKLIGSFEQDNQLFLDFKEHDTKKRFRVPIQEIDAIERKTLIPENFNVAQFGLDVLKSFLRAPLTLHGIVKGPFFPHRTVLDKERIRIDGQLWTSKQTAITIADVVESFDLKMSNSGFRVPYFTKILLTDRPILPGDGPRTYVYPIFSLRRFRPGHLIYLEPNEYNVKLALDPQVIRHERTHSILFSTYTTNSFVNSYHPLNEALADFLAAHASDNPEIGSEETSGVVRHIEKMESENGNIRTLLDLRNLGFHDQSMLLSNLLWRVRQKVGSQDLDPYLKPLLDALNSTNGLVFENGIDETQQVIRTYEFMMAVLMRVGKNTPIMAGVNEIVDEVVLQFKLDKGKVISLERNLVDSGKTMERQKIPFLEVITGYVASGFFLGFEMIGVFTLLN